MLDRPQAASATGPERGEERVGRFARPVADRAAAKRRGLNKAPLDVVTISQDSGADAEGFLDDDIFSGRLF